MNIIKRFIYTGMVSDLLVLAFIIAITVNYNNEANLAPLSLFMILQLGILWYFCRICMFLFPVISNYVIYTILLIGLIEAIWGLGQLYNFLPSKHFLFKTTGSFFNPGPYGGFIALMFPLALHFWLIYKKKNRILEYLFLAVGIVLLLVFPATLSRTAWIAAIIGCLLVVLFDTKAIAKLKNFKKQHPGKVISLAAIITVLFMGSIYGIFHLKKDSANGRLFMWKITALAIRESPVQGVGLGGFPAAYAQAQMDYFKSGIGSETEKQVAGSPEYAFNEYLRIFLEQGVLGGILFLLLTVFIIRSGIRNKQIGASGSFLTLSVFAFASYPYYLWEFLVMWVLLGSVCVSKTEKAHRKKKTKRNIYNFILFLIVLFACTLLCLKQLQLYSQAKKEWTKIRPLYNMRSYQSVMDGYAQLYPRLNHDQKFVFEYAVTLNAVKQHAKADSVLARGLQLSCDPMFYNVKGRNYHEMKKYKEAETCYLNSTYLLPERIYPYYLLTKLYADSANYQPQKMKRAAHAVLEKEPKVHSTAINEMRDEVKKILKSKEIEDEK
ncbi:O-antigen ligase family protein [Proteiniphilum propionicum]|uniref:O-antigen ligase family protein n=1 Tax=Proteiniphilum propionicum TaxID=2829812 RepID=UPI001EEA697D|nr:O-antigen ligase family protein [Proteiniphilum propionicum]